MSMTPFPPNLRYERKFLAEPMSLAEALAVVQRHPAMFREAYPPRSINNIYLDSPTLADYHEHVQGAAHRSKTRIRWYGPCGIAIERPVLERKIKRGEVGGKVSHPLPSMLLGADDPRRGIDAALRCDDMPPMLRAATDHLAPSLVNRYQRRYYVSADGNFRLTVDWDLQFASFARFAACGSLSPADGRVILELKYAPRHAESAADAVTNSLPFRLSKCSKYVLGIERLACGNVP
jgi:hypothetical protein